MTHGTASAWGVTEAQLLRMRRSVWPPLTPQVLAVLAYYAGDASATGCGQGWLRTVAHLKICGWLVRRPDFPFHQTTEAGHAALVGR